MHGYIPPEYNTSTTYQPYNISASTHNQSISHFRQTDVNSPFWTIPSRDNISITKQTADDTYSKAAKMLKILSELPPNWDGYHADQICERCTSIALNIIKSLPPVASNPDISPNPNGTITLEWDNETEILSAEIGANTISIFLIVNDEPSYFQGPHKEAINYILNALNKTIFPRSLYDTEHKEQASLIKIIIP